MKKNNHFLFFFIILTLKSTLSIHLTGNFKTKEFFKFLTRFGFQSTDIHNLETTKGYIYGNISSNSKANNNQRPLLALTILEKIDFLDFYKKTNIKPRDYACSVMFEKFNKQAYDSTCNKNGTFDIIRKIPCDKTCENQLEITPIIENSQFTYQISDENEAKFLYLSIVACERDNETCSWFSSSEESSNDYEISYSIYLTNGHPNVKSLNRFEHQFTYELHDVFEIYLFSMLIYLFILPFIAYRLYYNFHFFYLLLASYVAIEIFSRIMFSIHNLAFSYNGVGVKLFDYLGWLLEILAVCILILILLLIAKGYTITTKYIRFKNKFFIYWSILSAFSILSHMIALYTFNIIFHVNYYETRAGYVELTIRIIFMIWFLKELKRTFSYINSIRTANGKNFNKQNNGECRERLLVQQNEENNNNNLNSIDNKNTILFNNNNTSSGDDVNIEFVETITNSLLNSNRLNLFYLHFGACSLVWFIYLPILVLLSILVLTDLFRFRLMLSKYFLIRVYNISFLFLSLSGIRYFVNTICVSILIYIMWSSKTPLVLPGKIASNELSNTQYFFDLLYNQPDDDEDGDGNQNENKETE